MDGTERRRRCESCKKTVHNVEDMTRGQVLKVLQDNNGHCCMRIAHRHDGSIVFDERSIVRRCLAKHGPSLLLASLLALINGPRGADAETSLTPGYRLVTIEALVSSSLQADGYADVALYLAADGSKERRVLVVSRTRITALEESDANQSRSISLLVSDHDAIKLEAAKRVHSPVLRVEPPRESGAPPGSEMLRVMGEVVVDPEPAR